MSLDTQIIQIVSERNGCKVMELLGEKRLWPGLLEEPYLAERIADMVRGGQLIEVEYVEPDMEWRIKSYLFPPHMLPVAEKTVRDRLGRVSVIRTIHARSE